MHSTRPLAAVPLLLILAGCATPGPYAEVVGDRINSADPYEEDVWVLGVDGRLDLTGSKSQAIELGFRQLLLGTARKDRRSKGSSSVVPLNAKPCLRYHFVARHDSMSAVHPWHLVLKDVQPIPECVAKYPGQAPAAKPAPAPASQ